MIDAIKKIENKAKETEQQLFEALMGLENHMNDCDCDSDSGYHDFCNILNDNETKTFCLDCGGMIFVPNEDCY